MATKEILTSYKHTICPDANAGCMYACMVGKFFVRCAEEYEFCIHKKTPIEERQTRFPGLVEVMVE
jgi:hypothetical protein